ncbi:hypothetical protein CDIK_0366 [Cucumispora dikerogammari]|nr:hypothetical protein CDIK_0366 [Cucumispora dikerogammari]
MHEIIEIQDSISQILVTSLPFNNLIFMKGIFKIHQKNDTETIFIKLTLPKLFIKNTYFCRNILQFGDQKIIFKKKTIKSIVITNNYELTKECRIEIGKLEDIQFNSNSHFIIYKLLNFDDFNKFVECLVDYELNLLKLKSNGIQVEVQVEGSGEGKREFVFKIADFKYICKLLNIFETSRVFVGEDGVINFLFENEEVHLSVFIMAV